MGVSSLYHVVLASALQQSESTNVYTYPLPLGPPSHPPAIVVPSLSHIRLFATPRTAAFQASLSYTISRSLRKLISTELVPAIPPLIFDAHLTLDIQPT